MDIARYLAERGRLIERALARLLPPGRAQLRHAMRYSLFAGGKRIRPILTVAAGEIAGAPARRLLPFACALEMVHTYSLVHDDLPAMDDDDLRRGKPTSHKVYGEGLAILVGDALLTEAFRVMAATPGVAPAQRVAAIEELARAAGAEGMVGGQALDLAAEHTAATLAQVRGIHQRKTGALLLAAIRIGAIVGGARPALLACLSAYGRHLGLAFQIVDDVLDALEDPGADGRTDAALGKATYPAALGLRGAMAAAARERAAALRALRTLGEVAEPLRALAEHLVDGADRAMSRAASVA